MRNGAKAFGERPVFALASFDGQPSRYALACQTKRRSREGWCVWADSNGH